MPLAEVLSLARSLPRPEQLRLIQELAAGLQRPDGDAPLPEAGRECAVWSPDSAYGAAAVLLAALDTPESVP